MQFSDLISLCIQSFLLFASGGLDANNFSHPNAPLNIHSESVKAYSDSPQDDESAIKQQYARLEAALQKGDLNTLKDVFSTQFRRGSLDYTQVTEGFDQAFEDHRQAEQVVSALFNVETMNVDFKGDRAACTLQTFIVPKLIRPTFSARAAFAPTGQPDYWRLEADGQWRLVGEAP